MTDLGLTRLSQTKPLFKILSPQASIDTLASGACLNVAEGMRQGRERHRCLKQDR